MEEMSSTDQTADWGWDTDESRKKAEEKEKELAGGAPDSTQSAIEQVKQRLEAFKNKQQVGCAA